MEYREYRPRAPLSAIVDRIWTLEGQAAGGVQPVLPDGRPELIVHFGDAFERLDDRGGAARQPDTIVAGQLRSQLLLRPTGRVAVAAVRFHPDGLAGIVAAPQHLLAGLTSDAAAVSPEIGRLLAEVRRSAVSLPDAARLLHERLTRVMLPLDPRVRRAADVIRRRRGDIGIDVLAAHVGVTRRHLERRFLDVVGISPKRLARITRFQHALHALERTVAPGGAVVAAACGYADQAHFVREFRELAGCPPTRHLLGRAEMTGFFLQE
jgi:AraC-like DNA-binding protein